MEPKTYPKYFSEVDTLRAIAVISVIINHINHNWLPGGFLGVDIFFVISGFVVTASLVSKDEPTALVPFLKEFYVRRFKRLYPSLVFCVFISVIPAFFLISEVSVVLESGIYSLLGISNIMFAKASSDYFSPVMSANPFTHTWSLGVEEQFYLFFPLELIHSIIEACESKKQTCRSPIGIKYPSKMTDY